MRVLRMWWWTTNEGSGWLPEGFYLPHTMVHAVSDLNLLEFTEKWYGWADPARVLVDYAVTRSHLTGRPVVVRGLASMGAISEDTVTAWGAAGQHPATGGCKAVPSVAAEPGAKPLPEEPGRFLHRLRATQPDLFQWLHNSWAGRGEARLEAARDAVLAVMNTPAADPLKRPGGPWQLLEARGGLERGRLSEQEWAALRNDYDSGAVLCGALRPGFRAQSRPRDAIGSSYVTRFRELRAMEALLAWQHYPDVSASDIVYTAFAAGADLAAIT
ncbi:hypothetical protein C1Y40_04788 [Mycobacterium talmoniae]|uniref:Uncharacterized protein n=1 Tax=Mycobacterium talmoniae TaxID=1858794 RepID=A0A2S8BEI6_9MYCO|nr:hypothetical protein C1Y40_04788 [Mycobacterium talmoniae]